MSWSTFKALVFIAKALILFIRRINGEISAKDLADELKKMDDAIYKATNGELGERLKGGQEVEDQFNQHVGGAP